MISIHNVLFCDEFSQGSFGKINMIGYIPGNKIAVDQVPYTLQSTIVIEGKISKQTAQAHSLSLLFKDSSGNPLTAPPMDLGKLENNSDKEISFAFGIPNLEIEILSYDQFEITVLVDNDASFSKTFQIIEGESPNVRITDRLETSTLFPIGNADQVLDAILGSATKTLELIDSYLTPDFLLQKIHMVPSNTKIRILTGRSMKPKLRSKINEIRSLPHVIEIRFDDSFHDRGAIVNESECFHFGYSLKDLSKSRISRVSKIFKEKENIGI